MASEIMQKPHQEEADEKLVELAKANPDVFEIIVARYWQRLFYFIKRVSRFSNEDCEDVLQEVFIKVYRFLNDFDNSFKFSTWIYQIARNSIVDEIRKKQVRPQSIGLEHEDLMRVFKSVTNIENEIIAKDQMEKVRQIIFQMPYQYREAMVLRFLEEKNYEEIMDIIQKPKGTVASLISRGRDYVIQQAKIQKLLS